MLRRGIGAVDIDFHGAVRIWEEGIEQAVAHLELAVAALGEAHVVGHHE